MSKTHSKEEKYILKLYVTGMSISSVRAIENLKNICEEYLKGRYDLEIIDIYKFPESMYENNLIASPTLIKKSPLPSKKMLGDLSNKQKVLEALSLNTK